MGKHALMTACAIGALGLSGVARAATDTATTTATPPTQLSDIVVTAEKRETTLQHIPTAVSAYTSKMRDLVGIDTITDLQNFVPGLRYSASLDRIFLRGVGRQTNNLATDPGVATYVDGVYDSATYDAGGDELFIARQEVLRGPQGTLYGRNSIGGDINVISVMPTDAFYAEARASVGNYGRYEVEGVASGPINDNLRFRIGGAYTDQEQGYFRNVAVRGQTEDGDEKAGYFEAQLAATVGKLDLWGKVSVDSYSGTYRATNDVSPYDTDEFLPATLGPNAGYAYNPAFTAEGGTFTQVGHVTTNPATSNQWLYNTAVPDLISIKPNYGFTWHATYHADGFDVKYLGGYAHHLLQITGEFSGGTPVTSITIPTRPFSDCSLGGAFGGFIPFGAPCSGPLTIPGPTLSIYTEDKTWYSHELDFISTNDSPLQWIGGLYYYHENYVQFSNFFDPSYAALRTPLMAYTGPASAEFFQLPTPAVSAPVNPTQSFDETGESFNANSYAGFGQLDWKLSPTWKVTGGLRYTYDDKSGFEFLRELCVSCANFLGAGFLPENLGSLTPIWDVTSPTSGFIFTGKSMGAGPTQFGQTVLGLPGFATRALSGHWSGLTGTAGVEWDPSSDLLAYLKYSRGYKSGGFNAGSIVASPEVGPETLDDLEGGFKKTFGGALTVDMAGFYYWYHNMQIELGEEGVGGTTTFFLQGVPLVENWGVELESTWQATDDLQFILSYAYLNTRIVKSSCYQDPVSTAPSSPGCVVAGNPATAVGIFNVAGNQLIDSPPNKLAVNANYTFHFTPGKLTLSASDIWTDGHFSALFNTPDYFSPGYNELDLRALWTDPKDRYTVILFAKNVLNAVQYDYIYPGTSIYTSGPKAGQPTGISHALNAPLTFGAQVQVRWR